MIKSLSLKNFQAHKRLKLDLSPCVNTICGPTDSGKSAIIRALRWLSQNKPSGDAFIRHGAKKASVTLEVDDIRIKRSRGSENTYSLKDGEDNQVFRSFGNNVPEPIEDALCLSPINFQNQHDPPFWLSDSAGEVSRQLNAVVNLEEIDRILSKIASTVRDAKNTAKVQETRLHSAKETLAATRNAVVLDKLLKAAESAEQKQMDVARSIEYLTEIIDEIAAQERETELANQEGEAALEVLNCVGALIDCEEQIDDISSLLIEISHRDSIKSPPDIKPLEDMRFRLESPRRAVTSLAMLIKKIEEQERIVEEAVRREKKAAQNLKDEMEGRCPICGNQLP